VSLCVPLCRCRCDVSDMKNYTPTTTTKLALNHSFFGGVFFLFSGDFFSGLPMAAVMRGSSMLSSSDLDYSSLKAIWEVIPARFRHITPKPIFKTNRDGYSLKTLYERCEEHAPTLLLIRSTEGSVFGAYLSAPL